METLTVLIENLVNERLKEAVLASKREQNRKYFNAYRKRNIDDYRKYQREYYQKRRESQNQQKANQECLSGANENINII